MDVGGKIFIASLKLLVVPLVFVSWSAVPVTSPDGAAMGRVGGKALGLFLLTTAIAISLALMVSLTIKPGEG